MPAEIDPAFTELPSRQLADAALTRLRELGCEHGDFRLERSRDNYLSLHDARLDGSQDAEDVGFAVRVVHDGSWGFASAVQDGSPIVSELRVFPAEDDDNPYGKWSAEREGSLAEAPPGGLTTRKLRQVTLDRYLRELLPDAMRA